MVDEKRGRPGVRARATLIDPFPVDAVALRHRRLGSVKKGSRSDEYVDAFSAALAEQIRARPNGRGGGTDVVDQQDSLAVYGAPRAERERRPDVAAPRPFAESHLGRRGARSHQETRVQWKTEPSRRLASQQQSLVESAAPQPLQVQRNGRRDVEALAGIRIPVGEQRRERSRESAAASVFEPA